MHFSFDYLAVGVFAVVQWRISRALLAAAGRRWRGAGLGAVRWAVAGFNVAVALGYVITWPYMATILRVSGPHATLVGALALGYLMIATGALAVHAISRGIGRRWSAPADLGRRRAIQTAGNALMAAPLAVMGYGTFIERSDFRVRHVDIPLADLPAELDGLRILQLSDIHLSIFLREDELAWVIDQSNELKPHLAVVTGDLISARGDPLDACLRQLTRLKADAGVLGCLGNHERYARVEDYTTRAAARLGIDFLRDRARGLRFGGAVLNLAGVDYQRMGEKHLYLRHAGALVKPGTCNILLSHNPDVLPVAARQGYDLVLSGHTHGGQVTVEILDHSLSPAHFFTPYVYGLYRVGRTAEYVTRGIGTIGVPARIGAPPEISLLRLKKA
ncbi:MAG: metallophosphoesterase [Bryobacteraceae bacterium]